MVEETVACDTLIDDVGIEQWQNALKTVACDEQFSSNNLIAQFQGFTQKGAIVVDGEQSLCGGVA